MPIIEFLSQPVWQRLGLTLVHFLWQGLAIAILIGAFVRVLKLNHGNSRYAAYLLAFVAMIACLVVTFINIDISASPDVGFIPEAKLTEPVNNATENSLPVANNLSKAGTSSSYKTKSATRTNSIPFHECINSYLHMSLPWLLSIWMVGVIILSMRLLMGYTGVYRWCRHLKPLPERLAQRIATLSQRLGMQGFSRIFISPSVLRAMAVGYLRPMVLLPAAMVMQMQSEMLEAVIAHELAHIRRFDMWVILAQRVMETLLFYHPAVWWLSNCLQRERELCCDELAVAATGERLTYVSTLEDVSRARFTAKQPVLAAGLGQNKKPTLSRVRHILGLAPAQQNCPFWVVGVIVVLFLAALIIPTAIALTLQPGETTDVEAEMPIILSPDSEEFIESLNLTSPDVIRYVRTLFQSPDKITSDQAADIVNKLITDSRAEAKRAAADLLACHYGWARILVIRYLPITDDETEYFLTKIVQWWDNLDPKDKRQLRWSLPPVLRTNKGNTAIEDLGDEITALMISSSGKTVPIAGIELAKELNLESDRILDAIEKQRDNSIYDYFNNVHPVRKAAREFFGEEYVPPQREQVNYSQISVAKEMGLERSDGLTVGILTSLYTATGPCISSGDVYGWYSQCYLFPMFANTGIDTRIYFHPITMVEDTSLRHKLWSSGLADTPILNAASSYDLSMCDVVVLSGVRNLRPEVVDALEDFVWNGGAIITLDGAGIVACAASKKLAALQDMRNLAWAWKRAADQTFVRTTENPLTRDIDLSLPSDTPGRAFERNGYTFNSSRYDDQVLLLFQPDTAVALRVSTYGDGRIAHFGWIPRFGSDGIGERNWQLFHRVLLWAAGQDYVDLRPKPAYSKERYQGTKGIFGRVVDAMR